MDMDDNESMEMTFSGWGSYQLKLIFSFWDIKTETQFFWSCVAVFFFSAGYHGIRNQLYNLESKIKSDFPHEVTENGNKYDNEIVGSLQYWRLFHAGLSAVVYGYGLFMMLIAMSYNPALFLSLVCGYSFGNYLYFQTQP